MKTDKEIMELVMKDAPKTSDESWTIYSKQRRIKGKVAKESFISGFAFGRNFPNQDISWFHFRSHPNHTIVVKVAKSFLSGIWDITGDFLRSQFGVPGSDLEVLDMDGRVDVIFNHPFVNQDGIFEIIAIPGHERDQHVSTQGKFAGIGARPISQHLPNLYLVAFFHNGLLVEASACVRTKIFSERVVVNTTLWITLWLTQKLWGSLAIFGNDYAVGVG